jgi:hypothetical protein
MATLQFNKVHKNGWISYRQVGTTGAVFIDRRMVEPSFSENPPATIEVDLPFVAPGADATARAAEKSEKAQAREAAKAAKAEANAQKQADRLAKLQAKADAAAARAAAAAERAAGAGGQ